MRRSVQELAVVAMLCPLGVCLLIRRGSTGRFFSAIAPTLENTTLGSPRLVSSSSW